MLHGIGSSCYGGQEIELTFIITISIYFFILPSTEYLQRPRTSSLEKILARRRSINNKNIPDAGDQKTILDFTVQVRALSFGSVLSNFFTGHWFVLIDTLGPLTVSACESVGEL